MWLSLEVHFILSAGCQQFYEYTLVIEAISWPSRLNGLTDIPVFLLFDSNNEKREELQHDLQAAIPKLDEWKAHIVRSVHQDAAKTAVVDNLSQTEALLIMDWAMKFLPTSYRETQRDWFGKKGKPWHITVAITKADNEEVEVSFKDKTTNVLQTFPTIDKFHTNCNNA